MKILRMHIKRKSTDSAESLFDFSTKLWQNFECQIGRDFYIDSMKNFWDGYLLNAKVYSSKGFLFRTFNFITVRIETIEFEDELFGTFIYLPKFLPFKQKMILSTMSIFLNKYFLGEGYQIELDWEIFEGKRPDFNSKPTEIRGN